MQFRGKRLNKGKKAFRKTSTEKKQAVESQITGQREIRLLNKRKQKKQAIHNESDKQKENRLTQKKQKAKKAYHDRSSQGQEICSTKKV